MSDDPIKQLGKPRMRGIDLELQRLNDRIEELEADKRRLIAANTELNDEIARGKSWRWLDSTYALQRNAYGHNLPYAPNTNVLADYVQMNSLAAIDEIMEMLGEIGWKPWASPRGWVRREHFMKEAVDVAHFIANSLCAVGITDDEFWEAYRAKQEVNSRRQELGYDGVSGKCPGCRRSYDDGIDCAPANGEDSESKLAFCVIEDMYVDPRE